MDSGKERQRREEISRSVIQKDFCNTIGQKQTYAPRQLSPLFDLLVGGQVHVAAADVGHGRPYVRALSTSARYRITFQFV
jgi:hypothetical protein